MPTAEQRLNNAPTHPTFPRFLSIIKSLRHVSLLRALQYEALHAETFSGLVLDYGGGETAAYRDVLEKCEYKSVNIDPNINPTHIIKVGEQIPEDDCSFDYILSLNTLEHIYDAKQVVQEMCRVLKPGGAAIISTPFLFRVHGHPDDFFRPTPSWFKKTCIEAGFQTIEVRPLSFGLFSSGWFSTNISKFPSKPIMVLALLLDLLVEKIRPMSKSPVNERHLNSALGFWVTAQK